MDDPRYYGGQTLMFVLLFIFLTLMDALVPNFIIFEAAKWFIGIVSGVMYFTWITVYLKTVYPVLFASIKEGYYSCIVIVVVIVCQCIIYF
jgi:hypothetical protein